MKYGTLLERTDPGFYSEWATAAREAGLSEKEIDEYVDRAIAEMKALVNGKCPKCDQPARRIVVSHSRWVLYRCSTQPPPGQLRGDGVCDYMCDLAERRSYDG